MEKINKININSVEYNISALEVEPQQNLNMISESETIPTKINFEVPSTEEFSTEGKVKGIVSLNKDGNLSIQSSHADVSIDANSRINFIPTDEIVLDTSKRVKNSHGNNINIVTKFSEYNNETAGLYPEDDTEFGDLKLNTKSAEIISHNTGNVVLGPCGANNSVESYIKFSSNRTTPLTGTTASYSGDGSDGLEFGRFNNEHSSLFTKDYRFNKLGKVYAATRGNITTIEGKTNYPDQLDGFKDIIEESLGATWEDIINAANLIKQYRASGLNVQDLIDCVSHYKQS